MTDKLRIAVIREELVRLTGDAISAVILNQMLFHLEYSESIDRYIAEEKERDPDVKINPTQGWIYKTAKELCDEIMLDVSISGVSRRLVALVDKGWLQRRENPYHKWDHTLQYRVDVCKIQGDLERLGYALNGYPLLTQLARDRSIVHSATPNVQDAQSSVRDAQTIPESTTESVNSSALALSAAADVASTTTQAPVMQAKRKAKPAAAKEPAEPKPPRPRDLVFDAVAELCVLDVKIKTNASLIAKVANELKSAGYDQTHVARFGKWWLSDNWRRTNTPIPKPIQVLQQFAQGAHYTNGDTRASPLLSAETPGQKKLRELREQQNDRMWEA